MRLLISGSGGLIGSHLSAELVRQGHTVVALVRQPRTGQGEILWNPASGQTVIAKWEGVDAVVHLAGESVGQRWTEQKKREIRDSRVIGTQSLCRILARLTSPPRTLICASAVGYYGDCGDDWVREERPPGQLFLSEVCREWEAAAAAAKGSGLRVVNPRISMVLSMKGGPLQQMLTPFRSGLGGRIGGGRQYWSWIALDDVVAAFIHLLQAQTIEGPINLASPNPVTNQEFTRTLGRVLRRPTLLPIPLFALHAMLGEAVEEILLPSCRLDSTRLQASGFAFQCGQLEPALMHLLRGQLPGP